LEPSAVADPTNGGVQTPSEVFGALVNANTNDSGMSWIGTNSDGSQSGNSTIHSTDIANPVCGASWVIAWLRVQSISAYVVNIWY
jgi:hypothetical protein